ncbi:CBL-interacting serine/threonine-protein kinase 19 [Hibiscus syriacus]|uniref:non-specific serine/threonine protein kinase n=1 Tax=Hibiscus syriacus TaxID=106335 RepID=A0A6A2ZH59_HIBSY|nr:CBL-interacting serine/threonine-protein kinase 19 [Hibiscus syriacus]
MTKMQSYKTAMAAGDDGFYSHHGAHHGPVLKVDFDESLNYVVTHPIDATWTAVWKLQHQFSLLTIMEKKGRVVMEKFELGRLLGQGTLPSRRFVMEYVKGGELFSKVAKGKLKEDDARQYFQQLIAAVDYCHSRGVYLRDLKPENLLVDENGNLKVSDFGLSALRESRRQDGLLHTTCGTPAYVAPEVIDMKGYDGAKVDIWSCGVILYVLLAGFLPFHDENLMELYKKISKREFRCPRWFPPEGINISTPDRDRNDDSIIKDVHAAFDDWSSLPSGNEDDGDDKTQGCIMTPIFFNAFDLTALSQGFDLSGLFEEDLDQRDCSRFTTKKPTTDIVSKFQEIAQSECFRIMNKDGKVKLQGVKEGRKGLLAIDAEIFEVTPSFLCGGDDQNVWGYVGI